MGSVDHINAWSPIPFMEGSKFRFVVSDPRASISSSNDVYGEICDLHAEEELVGSVVLSCFLRGPLTEVDRLDEWNHFEAEDEAVIEREVSFPLRGKTPYVGTFLGCYRDNIVNLLVVICCGALFKRACSTPCFLWWHFIRGMYLQFNMKCFNYFLSACFKACCCYHCRKSKNESEKDACVLREADWGIFLD